MAIWTISMRVLKKQKTDKRYFRGNDTSLLYTEIEVETTGVSRVKR